MAKARGVKLGNPNGAETLRRAGKGGVALRAAVSANAGAFSRDSRQWTRTSKRRDTFH